MKTIVGILIIIFSIAIINGCKHEIINPNGDNSIDSTLYPGGICFERDILPIFTSNCAMSGCHDVASQASGYILNTYSSIVSKGIVPGNAANSKIYKVLIETDPGDRMPQQPLPPLTASQIAVIKNWINSGAPNGTNCSTNCDPNVFTYSKAVRPTIETYCLGCHNNSNAGGGYSFSTFSQVQTIALNGKLVGVISHSVGFSPMPKGGAKLSDCKIQQITKWVNSGAPNN